MVRTWLSLLRLAGAPGDGLSQTEDSCTFGDRTFLQGENLGDAFPTRCGNTDEWPCFCNPSMERSAECPYCSFATGDGGLYCAKDGESIEFRDGSINRKCTCVIPDDPLAFPTRECTSSAAELGCNWFDLNGDPIFIENGESFGDLIERECGPASEWPSFCYVPPGSSGGDDFLIDYPYCVFSNTATEEVVCAKDGDTVEFVDDQGNSLSCSCSYTPEDGEDSTCDRIPEEPTAAPNRPSGSSRRRLSPELVATLMAAGFYSLYDIFADT